MSAPGCSCMSCQRIVPDQFSNTSPPIWYNRVVVLSRLAHVHEMGECCWVLSSRLLCLLRACSQRAWEEVCSKVRCQLCHASVEEFIPKFDFLCAKVPPACPVTCTLSVGFTLGFFAASKLLPEYGAMSETQVFPTCFQILFVLDGFAASV